jgi:Fur family transcriptional regulator, ferric uptake regulator
MTTVHHARPASFTDLPQAVELLRQRGLRLSTIRLLLLQTLFEQAGPASAEHLARSLGTDIASIYRNLETFESHGLVRHVHLGHGPGLYALLTGAEQEYLYCERCGSVAAVDSRQLEPVRRELRRRFGHEAHFTHFAMVGLCRRCSPTCEVDHAPKAADSVRAA